MKFCKTCSTEKEEFDFNICSRTKDRLQYSCRKCSNKLNRQWKQKNPERNAQRIKEWRANNPLRNKASQWTRNGINFSPKDYITHLNKQEGKCAICKISKDLLNVDLAVDHCHVTGKVRGLLCQMCNRGLGHFKDDPVLIYKAIQYLEKIDD